VDGLSVLPSPIALWGKLANGLPLSDEAAEENILDGGLKTLSRDDIIRFITVMDGWYQRLPFPNRHVDENLFLGS
jgi:hypothetical protein